MPKQRHTWLLVLVIALCLPVGYYLETHKNENAPTSSTAMNGVDSSFAVVQHMLGPDIANAATPAASRDTTATSVSQQDTMRYVTMSDSLRVWKYLGGDPAGLPLDEQLKHMTSIPKQVRAAFAGYLAEGVQPDSVWIHSTKQNPVMVHALAFGGRHNKVFKVWPNALCAWRDKKTGTPIDTTLAFVYPSYPWEGKRYQLVQFAACTNGAFLIEPMEQPRVEMPPPPATPPDVAPPDTLPTAFVPPIPPVPPVTPPSPPPNRVTDIPFEPANAASFVWNGTAWLTGEYVDGRSSPTKSGNHTNGFSGAEVTAQKSYGSKLIYVFRVAGGAIEERAGGGHIRGGLRVPLMKPLYWGVFGELGGYYQADQVIWREEAWVSQTMLHWEERRTTLSDVGGYARARGYGPSQFTWDARAATGKRLDHEYEAEAEVSPGPLYVKAVVKETANKDRSIDDEGVTIPGSTFRTAEAAVGFRPRSNHRISAGWKDWKLQSPVWMFDWRGPSLQYDWRINRNWRFRADVTHFNDTHEEDPIAGVRSDNDHTRFVAGFNRNW